MSCRHYLQGDNRMTGKHGEVIIYASEDGLTKITVNLQNETVWLSLDQTAELFQRDKSTISRHIKNVFAEGELQSEATVANFAPVQHEENRQVERTIEYYNLDIINSVGYRVKSLRGTQFRIWDSFVLKEYTKKWVALDDERLKRSGSGNYWKELLDRIRDIRSSEKMLYRQVLDLYVTSINYNPVSEESIALQKAKEEYRKYQNIAIFTVEKAYLETLKTAAKTVKKAAKFKRKEDNLNAENK